MMHCILLTAWLGRHVVAASHRGRRSEAARQAGLGRSRATADPVLETSPCRAAEPALRLRLRAQLKADICVAAGPLRRVGG